MIREGVVIALSVTALLVSGCAKRPATSMATAPAPTGAASSTKAGGDQVQPAGHTEPAPAAARPAPAEYAATPELQDVHFDFDKYDIRPGDAKILDTDAAWLKQNGDRLVLIEGHCDERGTNEYNLALGERRARAAQNYLVAHGVAATRITVVSYGEERPTCTEHGESCWAKNRRAHFLTKRG
jgi:peptidoglycan-associated lipoprotein